MFFEKKIIFSLRIILNFVYKKTKNVSVASTKKKEVVKQFSNKKQQLSLNFYKTIRKVKIFELLIKNKKKCKEVF